MTLQEILEGLDKLWYEHDGDHFYRDEFREFITSTYKAVIEKTIDAVLTEIEKGEGWDKETNGYRKYLQDKIK